MKKLLFVLLSIASINLYCQFANNWIIGNNIGLNFNNNPPTTFTGGVCGNTDNSSAISNSSGNVLFYTDGMTVRSSNNAVMPNGSGLIGSFTAGQCAVIIPIPCNSNKYVIFHNTEYANPGYLNYTVVDMSLNGGLGDVVPAQKNVSLGSGWTEKLCAYYNGANNCYWVVTHKWGTNEFVSFKVDANSIATTSIVSPIGSAHTCGTVSSVHDAMGQLTISQDGSKLVNALTCQDKYEVFNFNQNTGVISNSISIPGNGGSAWGTAFSPNSQKLYVNSIFGPMLLQYDLSVYTYSAIIASSVTVYNTGANGYNYGYMELGPDGKIYIPRPNTSFISAVNNPDQAGLACNYSFTALSTSPQTAKWGCNRIAYNIPSPFSFSLTPAISNITCAGLSNGSATVSPSVPGNYSYTWTPGNFTTATASGLSPGTYSVLSSNSACATSSAVIVVSEPPAINMNITSSLTICRQQTATINSTVSGGSSPYGYSWSNGSTFSGINVSPNTTTIYSLTVTDANGCTSSAVTTVSVTICDQVKENSRQALYKIYPNPVSKTVYISGSIPAREIKIFNTLGREVLIVNSVTDEIDVSQLANGIYLVQIQTGEGQVYSVKIIKQE
jgi:hypothetical protein